MNRNIVLFMCLWGGFFGAYPLEAQGNNKDDYKFAKGLMEFAYLDLAKEVFTGIKNNNSLSKEERAKGELGLIFILKSEAEKEPDPEKQQKAFDDAITGLENFIKNNKALPEAKDAEFELGLLLQTKGKNFTRLAEKTGDAKYREVASVALERSVALFESIMKAEDANAPQPKEIDDDDEETAQHSETWLKARYYSFESIYYLGICFEKGSPKRIEVLTKAIKAIEEFAWSNEGLPVAYYAYMIQGDCYIALDKFDEAVTSYDSVCSLPVEVVAAKEIRQRGFLAKAKGLVDGNRGQQALDVTTEYFKNYPGENEKNSSMGLGLSLQQARAYAGVGDIGQALAIAQGITDRDQGYWAREAQFFISTLPIGGKLPTKTAYSIAEGHRKRGVSGKAIDHYELAIANPSTEEDFNELIPKSWFAIGASYFENELYDAAAKAYEAGAELSRGKQELLADNAYWAMRCYQELRAISKNPAYEEAYKKARTRLTQKFAKSKHAQGGTLQFLEGIDFQRAKEYDKAITEFKKLKAEDAKYERAQVEIGVCYYKQGKDNEKNQKTRDEFFNKATAQFKLCFDYADKHPLDADPEKQEERDASLANATFFTVSMSADLEKWDEVLTFADRFVNEPKYAKQSNLLAAVYRYQLQAYCKQNPPALDKAIEIYEKNQSDPKLAKAGYLASMANLIGVQLNRNLLDLEKKSKEEKDATKKKAIEQQIAELEPKAADYLYFSISNSPNPNPNNANNIGNLLYKVGRYKEAGEMFMIAYNSPQTDVKEKIIIRLKLAKCLVESEKWFEALPLYRQLVDENPSQAGLLRELAKTYVGLSEQKRIANAKPLLLKLLPETLNKEVKAAQGYSVKDQQKYITLRYPDIAEKLQTDEKFNTAPLKIMELIHKKRTQEAESSSGEDSENQLRHYLWREALAIYIDLGTFTPKNIPESTSKSEVNNPIWWEAKFYTPYLYEKCGNTAKAATLAKQMRELYPDLGAEFGFKEKFEDLLKRVAPEEGTDNDKKK